MFPLLRTHRVESSWEQLRVASSSILIREKQEPSQRFTPGRAVGFTMTLKRLSSAVFVSAFGPAVGFAQSQPVVIPAESAVPTSPAPVLPGTIDPQFPPGNGLPLPIPLQNTAANQSTNRPPQPNPPPIPPTPESDTKPAPQPTKEPGERFKKPDGQPGFPEAAFSDGHWCWTGWKYGPRIAPTWEYPGLGGGPGVTYPWGMPGYTGHNDERSLQKCCRLWGIPVPVYTPVPQPEAGNTRHFPGRNVSSPGLIYGWVGPFPASPRFKHYAVDVWAQPGVDLSTGRPNSDPAKVPGSGSDQKKSQAYMTLAVKVPHPEAEVFVDGVKTAQTGIERTFSSPDLEPGKEFRYELTVRWLDQGVKREKTQIVLGSSGQVIPLDFTAPEVIRAEK